MSWIHYDDTRTKDELREHFLIEKELATRLRNAEPHDRGRLYIEVYDELFRRIPHHSQLQASHDSAFRKRRAEQKLRLVGRFLTPKTRFLEIGCGDGSFSLSVAPQVGKVLAVDVSKEIASNLPQSNKIEFILSDGTSLSLPQASVDVAYSNQLMEHLHPDDANRQLTEVVRVLRPGGVYICITPNAISGPHDISQHFSDTAEGFHLKEYSWQELRQLFLTAGFDRFQLYAGGLGWYVAVPEFLVLALERILISLPRPLWKFFARTLVGRALLGINVVAWKHQNV